MADMKFQAADSLVASLEGTYKSLPALPKGFTDFIVSITPWLSLIFGILLVVFAGIASLISLVASPFVAMGGGAHSAVFLIVAAVVALIQGILMVMAFTKTQKRQMGGWRLLTYVTILGVVSSILTLSVSSIISGVIGAAIEFYLLFQIKSYYK